MPRSPTAPPASAWNAWSSRPAELVFLPLGVRVTPVLHADGARRATPFDEGAGVRLGRYALDAAMVERALERLDHDRLMTPSCGEQERVPCTRAIPSSGPSRSRSFGRPR